MLKLPHRRPPRGAAPAARGRGSAPGAERGGGGGAAPPTFSPARGRGGK